MVIVLVLIVLIPFTLKVVKPVKVSVVSLPNTAAPVTVKLCVPPATVPLVVIVAPVKVVLAPKVTLSLYVCVPEVVVMPPLMAVVPDASVTKLAAAKVLLIVLVPVLFKMTAPNGVPEPTAPVKVTPPLPLVTVNARAELLPTVDANDTRLFVVVKVVLAPKVTASP